MAAGRRGPLLTTFAILFALLALSNLLKPFQLEGETTGFVFLGQRMTRTAVRVGGRGASPQLAGTPGADGRRKPSARSTGTGQREAGCHC